MKKIVLLFFTLICNFAFADTGIYGSFVIIDKGNTAYYDCMTDTSNPNFQNHLGDFTATSTFILKGGEIKTWKNNGGDITGAFMYYRIYPTGTTPPSSFTEIALPWTENNTDGSANNQKWAKTDAIINLLTGLSEGNYTLEVFFKATTNEVDRYDSNNGANYKATFSIIEGKTVLGGKVTVTPEIPTRTENLTITLNATGTALAGASKVYLHSGVGTDKPNSYAFHKVVGNWGADDSLGEMTNKGNEQWEIQLTIDSYYNLTANDDAFALNFLFRSADGTQKEDNNGQNYHLNINAGNYLLLTKPAYSPFLTTSAQPFEIQAESSLPVNWILDELNADGSVKTANINTQNNLQNYTYNHTLSDIDKLHYYRLTADFGGGVIKTKTFQTQAHSSPVSQPMPVGAKKGVNYNFPNTGEVTFVLHTPTSTTYKYYDSNNCSGSTSTASTAVKKAVHLIGDFNNWQISDSYLLKKDGDYWWITLNVSTLLPTQNEYVYQFLVDGEIRIGDPYARKISDPDDQYINASVYPNLATYPQGKTTGRASVLELNKSEYQWQIPIFTRTKERNELNVYELHFRDFTPEGTYKAATQKLDYLSDLGITCIHVMPVSEFEGNDSWGYNPNYYFAADKAYGHENDLKEFIDEAHKRGIAVVNDLVLNHAFYSNPNAMLYWDKENNRPATDNPWFNAQHKAVYEQGGHWGADWNHASEHTRQMVNDIIDYWMNEFKFDGFRFDFTKGFSQKDPNPSDPWASGYDACRIEILKNMAQMVWKNTSGTGKAPYVIFEHLANDNEDKVLADAGILMWSGAGPQHSYMEMAMGHHTLSFAGSVYSSRRFTNANYMSYIESHDEERIAYKVKMWGKNKPAETDASYMNYLSNRAKLVATFNMLLPGPRMVWQFGELGYDISIDQNGRTGRKPNAWDLGYDKQAERQEIYRLYALMFALRNEYNLYQSVDYRNIDSTTDWQRTFSLRDTSKDVQVIAVGNFDIETTQTVSPDYSKTGTWFKYNGDPAVDGTPFVVNSTTDTYQLTTNDPVYILTNIDKISPKITEKTIEIETDKTSGYKVSGTLYDFQQEIFTTLTATPKVGFASDNSGNIQLYISSINGSKVTETLSINGKTINGVSSLSGKILPIGENTIRWVAVDSFGNKAEANQTITVKLVTIATPTISVDNQCGKTILTATNFSGNLLWSTGETSSSIEVTTNGIYTLTQTIGSHTSGEASENVIVKNIPQTPIILVDNQIGRTILTASNYIGDLLWSTGETTSSIEVKTSGTYGLTQIIDTCQSDMISENIIIQPESTQQELFFYNGMSVNADGANDIFRIEGVENYPNNTLKVFNAMGLLVFEIRGYDNHKNVFMGYSKSSVMRNNKKLANGMYFYFFEYFDHQGKAHQKQGWLYLK